MSDTVNFPGGRIAKDKTAKKVGVREILLKALSELDNGADFDKCIIVMAKYRPELDETDVVTLQAGINLLEQGGLIQLLNARFTKGLL